MSPRSFVIFADDVHCKAELKSPFLALPVEIRLKIYSILFENFYVNAHRTTLPPYRCQGDTGNVELAIAKRSNGTWPAIFMTCHRVYQEARPIFWSSIHLVFPHNQPPAGKALRVGLAHSDAARIRSVSMGVFHEVFLDRFGALERYVMECHLLRWDYNQQDSFHVWNNDEALIQHVVKNVPEIQTLLNWMQPASVKNPALSVYVLIKSWKCSYTVPGTKLINEPVFINLKTRNVTRNYQPELEDLPNSQNMVSSYRWASQIMRGDTWTRTRPARLTYPKIELDTTEKCRFDHRSELWCANCPTRELLEDGSVRHTGVITMDPPVLGHHDNMRRFQDYGEHYLQRTVPYAD